MDAARRIAVDEAGNVESWPTELQFNPATPDLTEPNGPLVITINPSAASQNDPTNWRRWFVPPLEQIVETRVTPTFWHENNPSAPPFRPNKNEANFGSA